MEVIVGKYAGFCGGVKAAVEKTEQALEEDSNLYCLGEVVHNKQVIEELEAKGLKIIQSIDEAPEGSRMVIRAHGEAEKIYEIAKEKNIEIIDTTCGIVKQIHEKAKKAREDSFVIVIGEREHPEVIGTLGFAGENSFVVQDEDDILDAYIAYENSGLHKVYVVAQTTFSSKKFDEIEDEIYTNFVEADDVVIEKTVCNATELRQAECIKLCKGVDVMVVIGGKNSSNTNKLADIAKANCKSSYFIQKVEDLDGVDLSNYKKAGIMAGASTPANSIESLKKYLEEV